MAMNFSTSIKAGIALTNQITIHLFRVDSVKVSDG